MGKWQQDIHCKSELCVRGHIREGGRLLRSRRLLCKKEGRRIKRPPASAPVVARRVRGTVSQRAGASRDNHLHHSTSYEAGHKPIQILDAGGEGEGTGFAGWDLPKACPSPPTPPLPHPPSPSQCIAARR